MKVKELLNMEELLSVVGVTIVVGMVGRAGRIWLSCRIILGIGARTTGQSNHPQVFVVCTIP